MDTITQTRPLSNEAADMERIGGVAAAQATVTKEPTRFQKALAVWLARRNELNEAPLDIDQRREDELTDLLFAAEEKVLSESPSSFSELRALTELIFQDPGSMPSPHLLSALFAALRKLDGNGPSPTFNAKDWLRYFERANGGWIERDGEIVLVHPAKPSDLMQELLWVLETRDGLAAVRDEIRSRSGRPSHSEWPTLLSRYLAAEARMNVHEAVIDSSAFGSPENIAHEELTAKLADEHSAALEALFAYPSPSVEAFRAKVRLYHTQQLYDWTDAGTFARVLAEEAERFTS